MELVRLMLRESGAWCRLEVEGTFAVHVGWVQYLKVGSSQPGQGALAITRELGLFPERLDASPYDFKTDEDGVLRSADDDFWAGLYRAVASGRVGLLEEEYVQNASRWHRLTSHTIDTVRAALAPRARLAVWPCGRIWPPTPLPSLTHSPQKASSRPSGRTAMARCTALSLTKTSSAGRPLA